MPRFCFLGHGWGVDSSYNTGWWFQFFLIIAAFWGNDQIWPMFFRWVETTNKNRFLLENFSSKAFRIFNSRICFFLLHVSWKWLPSWEREPENIFSHQTRSWGPVFFDSSWFWLEFLGNLFVLRRVCKNTPTWRIIPGLGYVVDIHGDHKSPSWGYSLSKWPFHGL